MFSSVQIANVNLILASVAMSGTCAVTVHIEVFSHSLLSTCIHIYHCVQTDPSLHTDSCVQLDDQNHVSPVTEQLLRKIWQGQQCKDFSLAHQYPQQSLFDEAYEPTMPTFTFSLRILQIGLLCQHVVCRSLSNRHVTRETCRVTVWTKKALVCLEAVCLQFTAHDRHWKVIWNRPIC